MKSTVVSEQFRRLARRQSLAAHLRAGALLVAVAFLVLFLAGSVFGQSQTSPHWEKGACQACHQLATPSPASAALRSSDADEMCLECHGEGAEGGFCRHVSGVLPGELSIPESYHPALKDGHLTCTTCHDLKVQCLAPSKSYRFMNPGFLRERTSRDTSEHCYSCHDRSAFEKLNPHDASGDGSCRLCHATNPVQGPDGNWFAVDYRMTHDLNDTCSGCHQVRPHPADAFSGVAPTWDHLAVPSDKVLARMRATGAGTGVSLPLEPVTGKIHCATCHDPHRDGLAGYRAASTPGSEHRLRLENMCQACHEK